MSTTYTRSTDKLEYICPRGHKGSITFKNFKNRNAGCKRCVSSKPRIRKAGKKKPEKYTIEFIKSIFEAEGYIVHTTEYINAKTQIEYTCPIGHNDSTLFYRFYIGGSRCNQCKYIKMADQFRLNFEDIRIEFKSLGFNLITSEYKLSTDILNFICPKGHNTNMAYYTWKNSEYKCYPCYLEILQKSKAFTYEQVKKMFEIKGCQLLSTNYINAKQQLEYICPNKHKNSVTLDGFNRVDTVVCEYCSNVHKHTIDEIKIKFEEVGYTLLAKEYIDAKTPLKFICNGGHTHQISWTHFRSGQRCAHCNINHGTQACKDYLDKLKLNYITEKSFPKCHLKKVLRFDLYVDNSFLIEFDGEQHFNPIDYFGGKETHKAQCMKDTIKNLFCIDSCIPLLRISYQEIKQIPDIINSFLCDLKKTDEKSPLIKFSNDKLYRNQKYMYDHLISKYVNNIK